MRALAKTRPYVDLERVGVWGWSGGGTNTLNLMFRYPDLYQVGMAVAPVPDQKLYDTIYQERYMGLPKDNEKGYQEGSAINFADGLRGQLLVVHGSGDDNVHYQGTERLVNRLVELGKSFDLMVYPNRTPRDRRGAGHESARAPVAGALPARASAPGTPAMIAALRSAWIWAASATLIVLWVPVLGVVRLLDRDPMRMPTGRWFRRLATAGVEGRTLGGCILSGAEHLDPKQVYVVVSNHQSLADIPLICHLHFDAKWLAKA